MKSLKLLKDEFDNIREHVKKAYKTEWKYMLILFCFAIFTYFLLISQNLTNTYDGLWSGTWYRAGEVEMGSGRWLWPYIDILHFAIQSGPVNAAGMLFLVCAGLTLIKNLFSPKGVSGYLAGFAYISNVIVCVALSYRHMALISGLAFLFSVLSAFAVVQSKNVVTGILSAMIPLAFSLGLYQTYLESVALILLFYMLYMIFEGKDIQHLKAYIIKSIGTVVSGIVLYRVFLEINLKVWRMELSDYKGANSVSISKMLRTFPDNVQQTYREWVAYFCKNKFSHNIIQLKLPIFYLVVFVVLILVLAVLLTKRIKEKRWVELVLALCAILAIPIAASIILLITPGVGVQIQMTTGLALIISGYIYLFGGILKDNKKILYRLWTMLCIFIMYGNFYMVIIDQEEMRESKNATTVLSTSILEDLKEYGYFTNDEEKPIAIVGPAASNRFYKKGGMWKNSNTYAKVGQFWTGAKCTRLSWEAVFRDLIPCELTFCEDERYDEIVKDKKFEDMPVFPNRGYIEDFGDTIVVKVSEEY